MELSNCIWIWILIFMAIVYQFPNGNALPILDAEDDDLYLNEGNDPMDRPELQSSIFDPVSDWNAPEDDRIVNILKRSGFQVSEGYERYPRIKDRVIIPFYSYGNNKGYYRSRPQLLGRPRVYFGYNPWNIESSQHANRFVSKGGYRY